MNASYPTWADRGKAALDKSRAPKPAKPPPPPTRAELCELVREEVRALTARSPRLRGKLLVMVDAIEAAKK